MSEKYLQIIFVFNKDYQTIKIKISDKLQLNTLKLEKFFLNETNKFKLKSL